ncbi:TIGR00304 family membrane protein [Acidianus sp.]|uniref:TIGR00304 family membrane protein n=1 Tax=Acidianus sp. TaxID=1872104 RepID=UPI00397D0A73
MKLSVIGVGMSLIFIGFALLFISALSCTVSTPSTTSTAVGGLVLIGPFPIFFGVGPKNELLPLTIFGIIFTIIAIIFFILTFYVFKKWSQRPEI